MLGGLAGGTETVCGKGAKETGKFKQMNSSPAVFINRVLNNCGIIMQTALLVTPRWLAKSKSLSLANRWINAGNAHTSD